MDNTDEFFQASDYNIIRILLSISGLWPFHTISRRCVIYAGVILILGSGFTFEVLGAIEVWNDSFELVDCLPLLALAIVTYMKLICAVYTLPKIKILLIKMKEYCLSLKSDQETKIHHWHMLYGRNISYLYTDKYYIPIFVHTATCEIWYMILITTFDVLYLMLVEHCCGLFAALRYRLENASEFEDDGNDSTFTEDKSYFNVVYSVRRHAEATQFVAIIESVHKLPLLVHIASSMIVLSVVGFQVITNAEDLKQVFKHASYLNGLLINIFFENWQGQKIIDCSGKVFESAYKAEWYKMSRPTKKLLMIVMMRSQKPLEITAGKLIVMSYISFNAVLRASSSYFMLLRSL